MVKEFIPAQFIEDKPIGEDKFKGQSHKRIAQSIADFIINTKANFNKHLIGLEGEWGSGKSNVIKILDEQILNRDAKDESTKNYIFYTYDAWGHQEDFSKRSFIEELIKFLQIEQLIDKAKWDKVVESKLSTNVISNTITKNDEKNNFLPIVFLSFIGFPVYRYFVEYLLIKYFNHIDYGLLSTSISIGILFLIIGFVQWRIKPKRLADLFYNYNGLSFGVKSNQTSKTLEPSVMIFREILKEICRDLYYKNIIVTYDNMDRLPADRVRELWSTIYTFFDEGENELNNLWVIVPYDQRHIGNIFKDENKEDGLTNNFIQKTFSLTFRVTPPIITQWKDYFDENLEIAFKPIPPESEVIKMIFERFYSGKTIKPRQIIDFINGIVVLFNQWEGKIPLKYCAGFQLLKDEILKDPIGQITGNDLSCLKLKPIFVNDSDTSKYFASLVFNVDPEHSEVLLKPRIENMLMNESPIDDSTINHPKFFDILNSSLDIDYDIHKAISLFSELTERFGRNRTLNFWSIIISNLILKNQFAWANFETEQQILLINSDTTHLESLIKYLVASTREASVKEHFKGEGYVEYIDLLDGFLLQEKIEFRIRPILPVVKMEIEEFISALNFSNVDYHEYSIVLNSSIDKLNIEINNFPLPKLKEYSKFLEKAIKVHNVDISGVLNKLRKELSELEDKMINNNVLDEILSVHVPILKNCAVNYTFNEIIPAKQAIWLMHRYVEFQRHPDIILSILQSSDHNNKTDSVFIQIMNSLQDDELLSISNESKYYLTIGDLFELSVNYKIPKIKKVIEYRLQHDNELSYDFEIVFENFKILFDDISGEAVEKLYLDMNTKFENGEDNISYNVTPDFLFCVVSNRKIRISQAIINLTLEEFGSIKKENWQTIFVENKKSKIFEKLVHIVWDMPKREYLPKSICEGYCLFIEEFITGKKVQKFDSSWNRILSHFKPSKTLIRLFKDVRDMLLNSIPTNIGEETILFFEQGVFLYGDVGELKVKDDFIRKILLQIIKKERLFEAIIYNRIKAIKELDLITSEHLEEIQNIVEEYIDKDKTLKGLYDFAELVDIPFSRKLIRKVDADKTWKLNYWDSKGIQIVNNSIVFEGLTSASQEGEVAVRDFKDLLEIGKTYEISCQAKALVADASAKFILWCHDSIVDGEKVEVNIKTEELIPAEGSELITLKFTPKKNTNIRIHLWFIPGNGRIQINDIKIHELI